MTDAPATKATVAGRTLRLTSLDKVLYPASETTKGEVLHYYATVGPTLLALIAHRPLTRVRWPHGVDADRFFEKNLPSGAPAWLDRVQVGDVTYPLVSDLGALTYLVNLNSLEFHTPQWRVDEAGDPRRPDRLVIDLDPGKPATLSECCRVALLVRDRLEALGMTLYPVTSGSKGLQLYAPLGGDLSSDQVRDLTQHLAQELTGRFPDLVVWKMSTALRPGKVLLDWSQNVAAKTTICPYSLRGTRTPTAAAPRTWDEIAEGATGPGRIEQVMFDQVLARLERYGDLLQPLHQPV